jgi:cysteine desulfurase
MQAMRDRLGASLVERIEGLQITGEGAPRNANTLHVTIPGVEAEPILVNLDREGIAVSAGSACSSGALKASHVLEAMNLPKDRIHGVLRLSLSRETTVGEIDQFLEVLPPIVDRLRALA